MVTCTACNERLFEYVYGLLEGAELQELREHLRACPTCQQALEHAQSHKTMMAKAALAIPSVPEFAPPVSSPVPARPETAPSPTTLPMTAAAKPARSMWRRPWIAWTSAAVILIAIGAFVSTYRHSLNTYQDNLTAQLRLHKAIDEDLAGLPAKYAALQKAATDRAQQRTTPYLHIVGPTQMQPNARAYLHVQAKHAASAQAQLRVQLTEATTGNVVQVTRTTTDNDGHARVELDASQAKAGSRLNVIVDAELAHARARVQDMIRIQQPTYVTRIDTNKAIYQINDVLFFRVLVLDRYSLQPPVQPIFVKVALKNPQDQVAASLDLPTAEGGILAKEFSIPGGFLTGSYVLSVTPLDAAQTPVQSAERRIEIVRDLRVPDIQLDQDRYLPGDVVTGIVRGGKEASEKATATFGNQPPVPVTIQPESIGQLAPLPGGAGGGGFAGAKKGKALPASAPLTQRFQMPIPQQVPAGSREVPFTLELQTGQQKTEYKGVIPLEPTDYDIDFFPEGGTLIAGVPNRVYYRVRFKSGEPVSGDGRVILMSRNEVVDSPTPYKLGLGYFDFTPDPKEAYTVRITSPVRTTEIQQPFAKHPIRPAGVVLHVPTAVGKQGESIRVTLRNRGPAQTLLLAAECRGQMVDQQWIQIKPGSQDFILTPAPHARGMIKVTAYEVSTPMNEEIDSELVPVAERLVYHAAVQRLELGIDLGTQQLQPGKNIFSRLTAQTEKGDAAGTWFLAAVVDERFQLPSRSLSAHFMLLNEIRAGSELEDAQVVLHDAPESAAMLERFLGTHGWRRFLPIPESMREPGNADAKVASAPLVFNRANRSLDKLNESNDTDLTSTLRPIRAAALKEEMELSELRVASAAAVLRASEDLQRFHEKVQLTGRLSLGALLACLLLASVILMVVGTLRIIRQHKSATPAVGTAFACLSLSLGVWFGGQALGTLEQGNAAPDLTPGLAGKVQRAQPDKALASRGAPSSFSHQTAPDGTYSSRIVSKSEPQQTRSVGDKKGFEQAKDVAIALQEQMGRAFRRDQGEVAAQVTGVNPRMDTLRDRGSAALKSPDMVAKKKGETQPVGPQTPLTKPGGVDDQPRKLADVEYFHQHVPSMVADTLLWHPALWIPNGLGEVRFDIASGQATYRILLLGHTPTGRFGFHESRFDVLPVAR